MLSNSKIALFRFLIRCFRKLSLKKNQIYICKAKGVNYKVYPQKQEENIKT